MGCDVVWCNPMRSDVMRLSAWVVWCDVMRLSAWVDGPPPTHGIYGGNLRQGIYGGGSTAGGLRKGIYGGDLRRESTEGNLRQGIFGRGSSAGDLHTCWNQATIFSPVHLGSPR